MNEAPAQPSRLELAAKIMAGFAANPKLADLCYSPDVHAKAALYWADVLIAYAKKAPESK